MIEDWMSGGGGRGVKVLPMWTKVADGHPDPHRKYLVRRDGFLFTATPLYGLHLPCWVVRTMQGEAPPVPFRDDDEWAELWAK